MLSTLYAWQFLRQPPATSDFRIFYVSAENPPDRMYEAPPGVRGNMNPPQFQLVVRPLTTMPLDAANRLFRAVNIACLCACLWWLWRDARASGLGWNAADLGALLSWVAMASMISLNEVAWLLWPLVLATWACWRRERWTSGAVAFGVALSLKPFLGVFVLWLLVTRRWKPMATTFAAAAASYGVGALVYGPSVFSAWLSALDNVRWWWAPMNASLQGWVARTAVPDGLITAAAPPWVRLVATALSAIVIAVTLYMVRRRSIDDSWRVLMAAALLASPLGWIYYLWWIVAGVRPVRLLFRSPLLWVPFAYVATQPSTRVSGATLASVYFWGLLLLWVQEIRLLAREQPLERLVAGERHAGLRVHEAH